MNERERSDRVKTSAAQKTALPLTWRDGAIPALALAMALLFWTCFGVEKVLDRDESPHLGILVLVATHFTAVCITLGRKARFSAGACFCLAASLALACSCTLWCETTFTLLNCFAILLLTAMATFGLAGLTPCCQARAVPETVVLSLRALCTKLRRPFQSLRSWGKQTGRKKAGTVVVSIVATVPVVCVVLWLLASADAVFAGFFRHIRFRLPPGIVWRTVRDVLTALCIASALWYIRETPTPGVRETPAARQRLALPYLLVTIPLDIVYIIFCFIQVKYLFGGAVEASMAGGWAQYARTGFFQLTAVTAIDLILCLLGTQKERFAAKGGPLLRAAYGLMLLCTAVILVSAFRRMCLYIGEYGLSVLRLITLWAMAAMAVGILAAGWKLIRPPFSFYRTAGAFAVAAWCVLCLSGPGRIIASYNVTNYIDGTLEEVDIPYLRSLSYDALPALTALSELQEQDAVNGAPEPDPAVGRTIRDLQAAAGRGASWTSWSVSAWRAAHGS